MRVSKCVVTRRPSRPLAWLALVAPLLMGGLPAKVVAQSHNQVAVSPHSSGFNATLPATPRQPRFQEDLPTEVERLARQLDDPELSLAARKQLEARLLRLGPAAEEFLPTVFTPAARQTFQRLRRQWSRQRAAEEVGGQRVSVPADSSLAEAFRSLETQSGNHWDLPSPLVGEVDEAFEDVLYWRALDRLLLAADKQLSDFPIRGDHLTLVDRPDRTDAEDHPPLRWVHYHEAFRLQAQALTVEKNLGDPSLDRLAVELELMWEPRLRPLEVVLLQDSLRAVVVGTPRTSEAQPDERRNSVDQPLPQALAMQRSTNMTIEPVANLPRAELTVPLRRPARAAQELSRLAGELDVLLVTGESEFVFADWEQPLPWLQQRGDVEVRLTKRFSEGEDMVVWIQVRFGEPDSALESHRTWIFRNPVWWSGPAGDRVVPESREAVEQGRDRLTLAFRFSGAEGWQAGRLHLRTPTLILRERVPFEFTELPLP